MMGDDDLFANDFDAIVESYVARRRSGDRPSIGEYVARFPQHAEAIQSLFPTLEVVEEVASAPSGGPRDARSGRESHRSVPDYIGEYRIIREIGRGGMGVVYEAVQESLGRQVALKLFPRPLGCHAVLEERFRREAQSAARLHHTNIAPVFGVGEVDGMLFYAMQFITGASLDSVLVDIRRVRRDANSPRTPPPPTREVSAITDLLCAEALDASRDPDANDVARPEVVTSGGHALRDAPSSRSYAQYFRNIAKLGVQVASALDYAHSHGIIHRDIKPSNLMLDTSGSVWVMDFGLAKTEGADELTEAGDVLGTLRYMAPEQLAGKAEPRSDIYSLGMTLYELATLRPAFDDPVKTRLMDRIRSEQPSRPSLIEPRIPRDLETILLKAIAHDPKDRYATAKAIGDDLSAFLSDRPISARRIGLWEQGARWCRRNPLVAGLAASIAALLLIVAVASLWTASALRQQRNDAYLANEAARRRLWQSKVSEARSIIFSRQPGQRARAILRIQEALEIVGHERLTDDELVDVRSVAASAFLLPDMATVKRWRPADAVTDGWFQTFDFDRHLEKYAVRLNGGGVSLRSVADDREIHRFSTMNRSPTICLSASGRRLAISDRAPPFERLEIWAADQQPPRLLHRGLGAFGKFVEFSGDEKRAAYFRQNAGLEIVDLRTRTVLQHPSPSGDRWRPLAFDRQGDRVAYGDGTIIRIQDVRSNQELAAITMDADVYSLAWHPAGRTLAAGLSSELISLVDVDRQRTIASFIGHANQGITAKFNHRGDRLISNDWSNRMRIWDVGSRRELLTFPSQGRTFQVCLDDTMIATQAEVLDGGLRLIRFDSGAEAGVVRQARGERIDWNDIVISPVDPIGCCRLPYSDGGQGGLALVNLDDGVIFSSIPHRADRPAAFLADGSLISQGVVGVYRWPRSADGDEITFGPPICLYPDSPIGLAAGSHDGSTVAIPLGTSEVVVIRRDRPALRVDTGLGSVGSVAVTPDGRLIAAANFATSTESGNIRVFETAAGTPVASLISTEDCFIAFSPDGQWLSARLDSATSRCQVWRVDQWETTRVPDALAVLFGHQGGWAATSGANGMIRIYHPENGRDIVRLTFPDEESVFARGFSGDDSILLVGSDRHDSGRLIDLRKIHQQLSELGLGWREPAFSKVQPAGEPRVKWRLDDAFVECR